MVPLLEIMEDTESVVHLDIVLPKEEVLMGMSGLSMLVIKNKIEKYQQVG